MERSNHHSAGITTPTTSASARPSSGMPSNVPSTCDGHSKPAANNADQIALFTALFIARSSWRERKHGIDELRGHARVGRGHEMETVVRHRSIVQIDQPSEIHVADAG